MSINKNISKTLKLSSTVLVSTLLSLAASAQTASKDDAMLEETVVTGIRGSLLKSLDTKRFADSIMDSITAEDMGKFPDENLAESLQRVPGVSISRADGEGAAITIRGMGPEFNRVTLNGRTATAATGGRGFNFAVIAPELVSGVDVIKAPTANLDEGGIGGTVNIRTAKPLDYDGLKLMGSLRESYEELSDDFGTRISGLVSQSFADDTIGVLAAVSLDQRNLRSDSFSANGYWGISGRIADQLPSPLPDSAREPVNAVPVLSLQDRKRKNFYAIAQWKPSDSLELWADVLYANLERETDVFSLAIPPSRGGMLVNEAQINGDGTITYLDMDSGFSNSNVENAIYEDTLKVFSVNGKWQSGPWEVRGEAARSDAQHTMDFVNGIIDVTRNRNTAGENRLIFDWRNNPRVPSITTNPNTDGFDWSNYTDQIYRLGTARKNNVNDEETSFKVEFDYNFDSGKIKMVQAGLKYSDRKFFDTFHSTGNQTFGRTGIALNVLPPEHQVAFPVDDFLSDESGNIPRTWAVYDPRALTSYFNLGDAPLKLSKPSASSLNEEITALFAQAHFDIIEDVSGNAGIRYVTTDQSSKGFTPAAIEWDTTSRPGNEFFIFDGDAELIDARTYSNVLWNLNLKYDVTEDVVVRAATARVLSRSGVGQLSPGATVNAIGQTMNSGNPDLDPYLATQFDFSAEWYFEEGSALVGGLFYKDIDSFLNNETSEVTIQCCGVSQTFIANRPENTQGGYLKGMELSLQTELPYNFGMMVNYTYVDSLLALEDGTETPIAGVSKNTVNIVAYYEDEKFSGRIAYNKRSTYFTGGSTANYSDTYRDGFGQVDANFSYQITDDIALTLSGVNLTNSENYTYSHFEDRAANITYTGRRFLLGVRATY